ncbi:DUF523 domain-containing protein [Methylobacterium goesingense]|uniref:Uncharacterized protein YbbK (DUF523 family) n=1 Tax=Methylobacterium goesingense TaxID=243690 RepID=A0ABV2L2E0_9HYPH|nr:DUF523 domain-containing protein [Methylobacterium goesingense]GJD73069.1 hypothetical protein CFIICLFH_1294 [Methylobacterium goesingense]
MIPQVGNGDLQRAAIEPAKVLVSACLMGRPVRYNGSAKALSHPLLERLAAEGRLVVVCPELSAGFSVPRPAAEIADGCDGDAVLTGTAKVIEATGGDVTGLYIAGAHAALKLAVENGCRFALLIDGSPSCGSGFIYDGSFGATKHAGSGVTAALLRQHGIEVFADCQIEALEHRLTSAPTPR